MKKTTLYRLTTTFLGADGSSAFYFDTLAAAEMNLAHLDNGEIEKVVITSDNELNYKSACTFNYLTYGCYDVSVEVVS